jgi:hypothetical protein
VKEEIAEVAEWGGGTRRREKENRTEEDESKERTR